MLSYEGVGKNIEKAIEDALLMLKASREDVDIKIIEEGGLFKKAKVLVTISEDCKNKYEKKEIKPEDEKEEVLDIKSLLTEEKTSKKETKEVVVKSTEVKSGDFLDGLLKITNLNAEIDKVEDSKYITYNITGENLNELIGYRGECLNAIQYLANVIEMRNNRDSKKIRIDVENYREKREGILVNLANRVARKVIKTNHQAKLEPMTANERRIIHAALTDNENVETVSKGIEPNRYLIITPVKK